MSSLNSASITSPANKTEECSRIIIDDVRESFTLFDVALIGQEYTFTFWVKSESAGTMTVDGTALQTSSTWTKYLNTFVATSTDIIFGFGALGTYYIYHPQLEIGNVSTDWARAPQDTEEAAENAQSSADKAQGIADNAFSLVTEAKLVIDRLENCISMLVTDENGESLMTQTSDGWTFSTSKLQGQADAASQLLAELVEKMGSAEATINLLSDSVEEYGLIAEFVKPGTYTYTDENGTEQTEPSIDLFETDTGFKLKITNTRILFTDGTTALVEINSKTKSLTTPRATVESELQLGSNSRTDGVWVWMQRNNGNLGLIWKGVNG